MDTWEWFGIVVVLLVLGYHIQKTHDRVKAMNNRLGRLSVTFLKIENDLEHLMHMVVGQHDDDLEVKERLAKIYHRRREMLGHIVSDMERTEHIMRGLELSDIDDDPAFWREDRLKRLGLEES